MFIKKCNNQDVPELDDDNDDDDDDLCWKLDEDSNDRNDQSLEIDFEKVKTLFIEYEILNKIDHPNIVKTYGLFLGDKDTNPAILLEYCPFNIHKDIKKNQKFPTCWNHLRNMLSNETCSCK